MKSKRFLLLFCLLSLFPYFANAEVFFSDGFESGDFSYTDPTSGADWGDTTSVTVSTDSVRTGSYSAKFTYWGDVDLGEDAWSELRFFLGSELTEVYVSFYILFPSDFVIRDTPSTDNTKLTYIWGDSYADDKNKIGIEFEEELKFLLKARKLDGFPSCSDSSSTGYISTAGLYDFTSKRGDWMNIEYRYKLDSGSGDGAVQMWVDGVLALDDDPLAWDGAPCGLNEFLQHGYLMGWSNSGFDEDTYVYIDDVVFSTTRIGEDAMLPAENLIIK